MRAGRWRLQPRRIHRRRCLDKLWRSSRLANRPNYRIRNGQHLTPQTELQELMYTVLLAEP